MLRASSSGIVLLKQCLSESQVRATQRRVVYHALQCYCLFHTHAPANSRFSTRFGSPLSTLINPPVEAGEAEAEGEGIREGEQQEELLPPGLGLDALGELDGKSIWERMRYYYLPWARPPPPRTSTRRVGQREGAAGVNGRSTRAGRKKRLVEKRMVNASSERRSRVRTKKPRRHKPGKVDNTEKTKEEIIASEVEGDAVEEAILDHVESSVSHQAPDNEVKIQEESINSYELHSEEVIHVEDLSAGQLQAIILDKNSDLMGLTWDAYQRLISLDTEFHYRTLSDSQQGAVSPSVVSSNLLITLANRLIAQRKHHHKNSREIFLRLISVYARLRKERARGGGVPYLRTPEWNCLIHFAGTGLRGKMSLEAYNASVDVYEDMLRGVEDARSAGRDSLLKEIEPDIYTYTSLLNIALRTEHQPAIEHAMKLLRESGKEPTRITHLCMIRYRYKYSGLVGVRALLSSLKPEDIGADGVTAYMACAGNDGYLDVVRNIYDALRRNVEMHEDGTYGPLANHTRHTEGKGSSDSSLGNDENSDTDTEKYMLIEGIRLPRSLVPSASIYNYTIQIFAYYGRLIDALQVFMDMLATRQPGPRGTMKFFQPNFAVFRGLFLGFARHGCRTDSKSSSFSPSTSTPLTEISQIPEWNWDRFNIILDALIEHSDSIRPPSDRMVYWIMTAVRRMTGDERLMRDVWRRLNERWYIRKGGRLKALDLKYGRTK